MPSNTPQATPQAEQPAGHSQGFSREPTDAVEEIRRAIDTLIENAVTDDDAKSAERLRSEYEVVLQHYENLRTRQARGGARQTTLTPSAAPPNQRRLGGASLSVDDELKYELELAMIAVEEKAIERDQLGNELAAISAEVAKETAPKSAQVQAEYKFKLAELALRRAAVQLEQLKNQRNKGKVSQPIGESR